MLIFILRRLGYGFLVIFGVIIVIFLLFFVLPGDPVTTITGGKGDEQTRKIITAELGLDQALSTQLFYYLNDLSPLAIHATGLESQQKYNYSILIYLGKNALVIKRPYMRRSYISNKRVDEILYEDIGGTLVLAITAMFFATFFGVVFGILAALRQNTWVDYSLVTLSVLGISTPAFVLAIIVAVTFGFYWASYTGLSLTGSLWEMDPFTGNRHIQLKNLILPAFTLALRPLSIIVQLTRSSMLDVLSQDYIRTAKAKGLLFRQVVLKHALKNALNPVITAVSGWLASLMAGAFFIEYIFNWKGLGRTTIQAVQTLDLPIVMGATIVIAFIFVITNIIVDILYAMIDPRIRLDA
jgi:ABC-type dipeptide/oligopeptide/nickel transport system permease component